MILFLILSFLLASVKSNSPTVQIDSGLIEGEYIQSNATNKFFYSFRGIPYAEPPTGELRFQPPVKKGPWKGILETKKYGSKCFQKSGGSEDCLFLNVYTPTMPSENGNGKSDLLPVMVYVHGGAFVKGSSSDWGPDYLLEKNVVLVAMNYRLHIFGFLNALDESAPGNAGLKDMVLALQWVQENIEKFNGDKTKVTILGHSAGSGSVQYLLQTKLTKGLFHRAIMQSGSTLNPWAIEQDPLDLIHKMSEVLNITDRKIPKIVQKFKDLSAGELFSAATNKAVLDEKHNAIRQRFVPSLEIDSPTAFQTESSYSIVSENKINSVPFMMGHVSNENLFFLGEIENGRLDLEEFEKDPFQLIPLSLNINNDTARLKYVSDEIRKYFFNGGSLNNVTAYFTSTSDDYFVRGIRKTIEFLRKNNEIYFYIFDYKDDSETSEYKGVPHVGELKYLFYRGINESEKDKLIREKMTTLWTNFAKTGNPTPSQDPVLENIKWPPVSNKEEDPTRCLYIGKKLAVQENPNQENVEFWDRIFTKYGKTPFFTY